jgi:hypothetical protein
VRRPILVGFVVGSAAGCARTGATPAVPEAPAPVTVAGPPAPIAAWFGAWDEDTGKFERRAKIPKVDGQTFGWRIKTRCTGPVRFREVMRLPAPGDWSVEDMPGTTISDDQTTTTTIDYAACKAGWVEHQWSVAEGDPAGTYVITVQLDGYATQTFRPKFVAGE